MPEIVQNVISCVISLLVWMITYYSGWYVFPKRIEKWNDRTEKEKYKLCSCLHSTLHGIVVPIGIFVVLMHCDIWNDFKANSCSEIEIVFAWTISYFAFDFVLVLQYKAEFWQVFMVHHIVGIMPFLVNCFFSSNLHFLVGLGICVEIANPFLNAQTAIDLFGMHDTDTAKHVTYITIIIWLIFRITLPIYLLIGMAWISIPAYGLDPWGVIFSYITGFAIGLFCVAVLFVVHVPAFLYYYRNEHVKERENVRELKDIEMSGNKIDKIAKTREPSEVESSSASTERKNSHPLALRRRTSSFHTC